MMRLDALHYNAIKIDIRCINMSHPKIENALKQFGYERFRKKAEAKLRRHPKCRIVLGLLNGPCTGRYGFSHTAGKNYPRVAVRYERDIGITDIRKHSGSYLYVSI